MRHAFKGFGILLSLQPIKPWCRIYAGGSWQLIKPCSPRDATLDTSLSQRVFKKPNEKWLAYKTTKYTRRSLENTAKLSVTARPNSPDRSAKASDSEPKSRRKLNTLRFTTRESKGNFDAEAMSWTLLKRNVRLHEARNSVLTGWKSNTGTRGRWEINRNGMWEIHKRWTLK